MGRNASLATGQKRSSGSRSRCLCPKIPDLCVAGLHRYLQTGEARVVGGTTELVGLRKDGSEFPIEMSLGEILEDGEQLFRGVIRDVTERKRIEDALREMRDRFRSTFDHAPIGVAMVSLEGRYLQVNRSLCEILGYTEEELQALTWQEIIHPDDLAASLAHACRIVEGEFPRYHLEKRFLHADGHAVWASLSVSLVRDSEGEPLYFVSQIQDVTERKTFEETLERLSRQHEMVLKSAGEGIIRPGPGRERNVRQPGCLRYDRVEHPRCPGPTNAQSCAPHETGRLSLSQRKCPIYAAFKEWGHSQ